MHYSLATIKIFFSATIVFAIALFIAGGFLIKKSSFEEAGFGPDTILRNIGWNIQSMADTFAYRREFDQTNEGASGVGTNLLASIAGAFPSETLSYSASGSSTQVAHSIPVLLYHGVTTEGGAGEVTPEVFKSQLFALKKAGWNTVSIADFYRFMRGEKQLPAKSFLLTFDDGRKESYYPVDSLLHALDYRAVMYVITGHSVGRADSTYYLSESELKTMLTSGRWDLQSHSQNGHGNIPLDATGTTGHFFGNKEWLQDKGRLETGDEFRARVTADLAGAKHDLEDTFKIPVYTFAFPFSDFSQGAASNFPQGKQILLSVVHDLYPFAFYQWWQGEGFSQNYPQRFAEDQNFLLKRIEPENSWSAERLLALMNQGEAKALPYHTGAVVANEGWTKTWGALMTTQSTLTLSATASTTGASAFLDGSYAWSDYVFEATLSRVHSYEVSLLARYTDNDHYVSCDYFDHTVRISRRINDTMTVLEEKKYPTITLEDNDVLGVRVIGDSVECLHNGTSSAFIKNSGSMVYTGGIGVSVWDAVPDDALATLTNMTVQGISTKNH